MGKILPLTIVLAMIVLPTISARLPSASLALRRLVWGMLLANVAYVVLMTVFLSKLRR
jgi:hypothetical protein